MRIILAKESTNEASDEWRDILTALVNAVNKQLAGRDYYALFKPASEKMRSFFLNIPNFHTTIIIECIPQENNIALWVGGDNVATWSIDAAKKDTEVIANEVVNSIDAVLHKTLSLLVRDAPPPPITMSSIAELLTSIFQLAERGIKEELEKSATIFLSERKIRQQPNIKVKILPNWGTLEWRFFRYESNNAWLSIKFNIIIVDSVIEGAVMESKSITLSITSSYEGRQCTVSVFPISLPSKEVLVSFKHPPLREHIAEVIVKAVGDFYREFREVGLFYYRQYFYAFRSIFENTIYKELMDVLRSFVPFPEQVISNGDFNIHKEEEVRKGLYFQIWLIPPGSAKGLGIIIHLSTMEENVFVYFSPENVTITGASIYAYFGDVSAHRYAPPEQLAHLTRSLYRQVGKIQLEEPVSMKDLPKAVRLGEILGKAVARFIANTTPHFVVNLAKVIKSISGA